MALSVDTFKPERKLVHAGFDDGQADAVAEVVRDAREDLATKSDLMNFMAGVDARFESLDVRFESIDARFEGIEARFETLQAQMMKTMYAKGSIVTCIIIGAMSLFKFVG